jgi:hypothetical protein
MAWIKRNLFFVIGTVIALALMGLAGFYLYSRWQLNEAVWGKLNEDYAELKRLSEAKPHPGNGKVDNRKAAQEQEQELRSFLQKARTGFVRIQPVPDLPKPSDQDFSSSLSFTIAQLRREATNNSVSLPNAYSFSFQAQQQKLQFSAGSTGPLSVQLGEVHAIASILFGARINALDGIRRERVSSDDAAGPLTDYLSDKTQTNDLAMVTPYEVTFRCFTPELGAVISGFANSPYSILVKSFNVEAAPAVAVEMAATPPPTMYMPQPLQPPPPVYTDPEAAFKARYGLGPSGGGRREYMQTQPQPQPGMPLPVATAPAAPTVALDERQLKVTLMLKVVKLKAQKIAGT